MSSSALAFAGNEKGLSQSYSVWFKRPFDVCLALLGFVLSLPIFVVAALLVKLTSRGPIFYSQIRLGLGGRPFRIYKLRTMYLDSEALTGPCWSTKGDPRVTPVGRFLRRTHLDELPQLWNIFCGEMSLIGPRPERPEMAAGLEQAIPRFRQRLLVRPGLTGLAQVQLPPDTDVESVRLKLAHDLYYLEDLSFLLDCRIFVATIFVVLGLPLRVTRPAFVLPGGTMVAKRYQESARKTTLVPDFQPV